MVSLHKLRLLQHTVNSKHGKPVPAEAVAAFVKSRRMSEVSKSKGKK